MCIRDRLIGCDVLRQHSAIINLQQGIVFLTSERGIWSAKVVNCNHTPTALNQGPVLKNYYCRNHETSMIKNDEDDNSELWEKKLEEIRIFQRNRPNQEISKKQVENLIKIYQKYQHVFSNTPGKVKGYQCKINFREPVDFHRKSYPIAYSLKNEVRAEINRMMEETL